MTKIRLKLAAFGDEENLIIETVEGVPEIRRERDAISSRDRRMHVSLGESPATYISIAVEEAP